MRRCGSAPRRAAGVEARGQPRDDERRETRRGGTSSPLPCPSARPPGHAPRVRTLRDFLIERFAREEAALDDLLNACR
ncbi:protein of unknown function [Burkholderia multivorans]